LLCACVGGGGGFGEDSSCLFCCIKANRQFISDPARSHPPNISKNIARTNKKLGGYNDCVG